MLHLIQVHVLERGLYGRCNHIIFAHATTTTLICVSSPWQQVCWNFHLSHVIEAHHGFQSGCRRLGDRMIITHLRVRIQRCISTFVLFDLFTTGGSSTCVVDDTLITSLLHLCLPLLLFCSCHLGFFSQYKVDLKSVGKEYDGRVVKEIRTGRVVVTLELN